MYKEQKLQPDIRVRFNRCIANIKRARNSPHNYNEIFQWMWSNQLTISYLTQVSYLNVNIRSLLYISYLNVKSKQEHVELYCINLKYVLNPTWCQNMRKLNNTRVYKNIIRLYD